jgi:hypothetical protein
VRPSSTKPGGACGFSLVEMLIATSLMLGVMAGVFQAMHPAYGSFRAEPEAADVQQRLRVGADTLARDLLAAGGGTYQGVNAGPLVDFFAPLLPMRQGRRSPDPPGTYRDDAVTFVRVDPGAAQTTIAQALAASSTSVQINLDPGCPPADSICGFKIGMDVIVFDDTGAYDTFTIVSVSGTAVNVQHNMRDSSKIYAASLSHIVAATSRTYFLKTDPATGASQLMRYEGAGGADVPVVDHVVGLSFEYFGDPEPPRMLRPITDLSGPWTTYGPKPPDSGQNCVFTANGSAVPEPGLPVLVGGPGLVRLTAAELTDGPWCPDAVSPNRFDADLLRVRAVAVTLRIEAAASTLRGPAGLLYARGGTSTGGHGLVPDQEIRFDVAPRNMNLRQ